MSDWEWAVGAVRQVSAGVIWIGVMLECALALGQPAPVSRPSIDVTVPVAGTATRLTVEQTITVRVGRLRAQRPRVCPAIDKTDWRVEIDGSCISVDANLRANVSGALRNAVAESRPKGRGDAAKYSLVIQADRAAPFGIISDIVEASGSNDIFMIWIATGVDGNVTVPLKALKCWLPRDKTVAVDEIAEIRVRLEWVGGRLVRTVGKEHFATGDSSALRAHLRDWRHRLTNERRCDVRLVVESGPLTEWQDVVDVMNEAEMLGAKIELWTLK